MRGGYRKGAGRKRGFAAQNAEEARRQLSDRVLQEIKPISDALVLKAKEGDIRAVHELFDRAWGRAPQAMEISVENKHAERTPEAQAELQKIADWMTELQYQGLINENPRELLRQLRK